MIYSFKTIGSVNNWHELEKVRILEMGEFSPALDESYLHIIYNCPYCGGIAQVYVQTEKVDSCKDIVIHCDFSRDANAGKLIKSHGAMIVSQRPTEISNTIISQVSTFIALRLTNSDDQSKVTSFAPNNFAAFLNGLPSLGTGEAFVIGESMKIPMKIKIPLLETVKNVKFDYRIAEWAKERAKEIDYTQTIEQWIQK